MYWPVKRWTTELTVLDGSTVSQEKSEILNRFGDHIDELLNIPGTLDVGLQWLFRKDPRYIVPQSLQT